MASITWSIVGLQISEAARAEAVRAGDEEAARLLALQRAIRRDNAPPDLQGLDRSQVYDSSVVGTPAYFLSRGWTYRNGVWSAPPEGVPLALQDPSAQVITTASVLGPSGQGGPRPAAALRTEFVGGDLETIRMTTGIGAPQDGPLTPIRMGTTALPRIVIDDQYT